MRSEELLGFLKHFAVHGLTLGVNLHERPLLGRGWHHVVTHMNASDQQTDQPSGFIEALTFGDNHLIKYI